MPRVPTTYRLVIDELGCVDDGITHVSARFVYMDVPNVPDMLRLDARMKLHKREEAAQPASVRLTRLLCGAPAIFGTAASDPTVSRLTTTRAVNADAALSAIEVARAGARRQVWRRASAQAPDHGAITGLRWSSTSRHPGHRALGEGTRGHPRRPQTARY